MACCSVSSNRISVTGARIGREAAVPVVKIREGVVIAKPSGRLNALLKGID